MFGKYSCPKCKPGVRKIFRKRFDRATAPHNFAEENIWRKRCLKVSLKYMRQKWRRKPKERSHISEAVGGESNQFPT